MEIESTNVIVASEPIRDTESGRSWRITGRTIEVLQQEANKISAAVSEDGYVVFTMPVLLKSGPFVGWFEITGISHDLL